MEGVRAAMAHAEAAYEALAVGDRLGLVVAEGVGHDVTDDMWAHVEAFLQQHLRPGRNKAKAAAL
jgi:hypothetical protein